MYKLKNVPMAMEALSLMGIGKECFSQDEETLFIKSVLVFRDMWYNKPPSTKNVDHPTEESAAGEGKHLTNMMQLDPV